MRPLLLAMIGVSMFLLSPAARASDGIGIRVHWERETSAASCPDEEALEGEVVGRLGRDPFAAQADVEISVEVARDAAAWRATLRVRRPGLADADPRLITSRATSCEPLFASVALAIALLVESESESPFEPPRLLPAEPVPEPDAAEPDAAEPDAAEPDTAEPDAAEPDAAEPPVAPTPAEESGVRGAVSVGLLLTVGLLPDVAVGPVLHGEIAVLSWLRADAGMYFLPAARHGTFAFGLSAGWLGSCATPTDVPLFALDICASLHAGVIHAVTYAPDPTFPGDRFWLAATAGARARAELGPVLVALALDLSVPITYYEFVVTDGGGGSTVVFAQSHAAFAGRLEIGCRFGPL